MENVIILVDTRLDYDCVVFSKLWGDKYYFNSFSCDQWNLAVLIRNFLLINDVQITNVITGDFSRVTFKLKGLKVLIKVHICTKY